MNEIKNWTVTLLCLWTVAATLWIAVNPSAVGRWEAERDQGYFAVMGAEYEQ